MTIKKAEMLIVLICLLYIVYTYKVSHWTSSMHHGYVPIKNLKRESENQN
jgi:hypothetical protein